MIEVLIKPRELPAGHDSELEIRHPVEQTRARGRARTSCSRASLPASFLLLRGRNRVEGAQVGAGDTRVHTMTVRPRSQGDFSVTSTNFSYRDEYGTPVRVPEFRAELTVLPALSSVPPMPVLDINVVSGPLAPDEWDELRLRVRSDSSSPLRGITLTIGGPIRIAAPDLPARLPDLAGRQEAEIAFTVCPTATGRRVSGQVVVNYTDPSGRARVQNQTIPLVVSSPSSAEHDPAAAPREGKHPYSCSPRSISNTRRSARTSLACAGNPTRRGRCSRRGTCLAARERSPLPSPGQATPGPRCSPSGP